MHVVWVIGLQSVVVWCALYVNPHVYYTLYVSRQQAYAPVTAALEHILSREQSLPLSPAVPLKPGPPVDREEQDKTNPHTEVREHTGAKCAPVS